MTPVRRAASSSAPRAAERCRSSAPGRFTPGNIVPFSTSFAYEENPTISYTPIDGAEYVRELLSPIRTAPGPHRSREPLTGTRSS